MPVPSTIAIGTIRPDVRGCAKGPFVGRGPDSNAPRPRGGRRAVACNAGLCRLLAGRERSP
eukprot:2143307-Lingulodinium_polyedra.AAC.1